ncbi:hypothetical protein P168DRAFT_64639 [Aspergillus campestris IBT 28561]|uniref:Uncharacterized protein n=1 Tax=Aspergillus campestris (strain IBT 28561) TaxID=1392248 RepID=A0A2I1CT56_ASPC2|nr:uncharacterized protein P168DRAFT_64639 [Aspergillus campestris IBT 28561]PKY00794.1 hypothetical protein P168DRAFT_64639 [Aspergillus campestris IBT 28561]
MSSPFFPHLQPFTLYLLSISFHGHETCTIPLHTNFSFFLFCFQRKDMHSEVAPLTCGIMMGRRSGMQNKYLSTCLFNIFSIPCSISAFCILIRIS